MIELTTKNGKITINKNDIDCFRGATAGDYNCVIYLKSYEIIYVYETFEQVNNIYSLPLPQPPNKKRDE